MAHQSAPPFLTLHALRIKGFAKAETLAELAALPVTDVEVHLTDLQQRELAMFREARALWQLTPAGREAHAVALAADVDGLDPAVALRDHYQEFLGQNEAFKILCGDWQLRDGGPNDHSDADYDRAVLDRLVELDAAARPIVSDMGGIVARFGHYEPRLEQTCRRVLAGETNMFTGVMCGSYHDVWMELHEDLILTQQIDRAREGSF
ncbi:MAG: MarR family transcriptional regulator [Acidimicrobiia bacterium]